jgi:hypothetical protein
MQNGRENDGRIDWMNTWQEARKTLVRPFNASPLPKLHQKKGIRRVRREKHGQRDSIGGSHLSSCRYQEASIDLLPGLELGGERHTTKGCIEEKNHQ